MAGGKVGNIVEAEINCIECGYTTTTITQDLITCPRCGGLLEINIKKVKEISFKELKGKGVWRYRQLIPGEYKKIISLGEGNTPLIKSSKFESLYLKFEGSNPTGSFKDRGMTVAVSAALSLNYKSIIVASTGNTAASAAAYSSRAGLKSFLIVPKGKVATGKIAQAVLHGSVILEIDGNFDIAMNIVQKLYKELKAFYPLNSFNPWRLEGQKTIAYEIVEEIGVPDIVIVPVGNAGNIYAIWKGFKELKDFGVTEKVPKMIGVQAKGASPIANYVQDGYKQIKFIDNPETIATAIRIGKPVNWKKAVKAIKESKGTTVIVSDDEIIRAQKDLAQIEGIGVEPASASTLAAYYKLLSEKVIDRSENVVLILTGHALKDPDVILNKINTNLISITHDNIEKIIAGELINVSS